MNDLSKYKQWHIRTEEDLKKLTNNDILYQKTATSTYFFQISIVKNKIGFRKVDSLDAPRQSKAPSFYELTFSPNESFSLTWIKNEYNIILTPIDKHQSILNKIKYLDERYESRNRERAMF
jgi:hypothetical protein